MYRYDEFDAAFVRSRTAQFRDQVARRLAGEISEEQFRPLRLHNGLYLQLHAYMLRVAIPYGVLSARQLEQLARIARKHDRGYGHFTTRTNIQFHWARLEETPDVLDLLADVDMHAIQTSGNCIRNTTTDPYAGVAIDEIEDPRVWAEIIRQWSTVHPEFLFLPRKFKIAITGAAEDRAAILYHDIGMRIVKGKGGETGFAIYVGGGQGRTPYVAEELRSFLPKEQLLSYLEAIMRVYNLHGRRDNLYKSRIKVLVKALGIEEFRRQVEEEWSKIDHVSIDLPQEEYDRIAAYFAPLPLVPGPITDAGVEKRRREDASFDSWVRNNVLPHRVAGHVIVNILLKEPGKVPGDATADQMEAVAALARAYGHDEIRVTYQQNLVLPNVALVDLVKVYDGLVAAGVAVGNYELITDIISCPGLDYCNLANARSIPVALEIAKRFADQSVAEDIGRLRLNVSGCINACGHHHSGNIGILGVDKKGTEHYQITLGGSPGDDAEVGTILGPSFPAEAVPDAIETIVATYRAHRREGEVFLATYRRIGQAPFKEALYGAPNSGASSRKQLQEA
ncbi:Nitrite/sulfite reductase ferredoxin-like half domain:Nitrite and sulfite reductase iron-sulfur/siroheme-binding site:Nitrite [Candidatus Filomicrobium marinum]|uniref:Nitrite/sulfite reductase ferredoxin-like half domain:Nitrite and sulfite reductase iron-sulfur/siroheme-binding site:Nitrite n=2 Tax=Filomicrobium TaxID=119044 RepID=A0A0D6JCB7_9HYPH|nr:MULTISPECIES: nitrite/sulfite reductase [Filomicrobium]CFX08241.1 Nitrite/sulfite reductase ferredoxin-like half domain:Nitrite and sulfite reductase iron-sulfur/siroheme-binding site:Nitrite [Candidatus Filomicrobium marinum]CPR16757.1 Nitrite/sulfite reductase ferredoxin-like half domain:Nitrite and sulfite reductase iron-sulfur/siroheme-binding site:Nitrite [Candidatus Filomicrobium marinum]SDP59710.1 sulfite reductase (NADPH) hemoprotein beta-component [Filomicrobium insigne]